MKFLKNMNAQSFQSHFKAGGVLARRCSETGKGQHSTENCNTNYNNSKLFYTMFKEYNIIILAETFYRTTDDTVESYRLLTLGPRSPFNPAEPGGPGGPWKTDKTMYSLSKRRASRGYLIKTAEISWVTKTKERGVNAARRANMILLYHTLCPHPPLFNTVLFQLSIDTKHYQAKNLLK